jgi:ABC-type lipoprotein release transport system permease subunit
MRLYSRLAWRNIWRHRRRTLIVVLSIGLSLAMMMMYDGLIAGFEQAIYGNAINVLGGNIQVHASGYQAKMSQNPLLPLENDQAAVQTVLAQPEVVAASRRIKTGGLTSNAKGAFAVSIIGIEPELEQPLSLIAQNVKEGRYLASDDKDIILIGKGLADAMEIIVGDRITLAGRATHEQMRSRTMTIVGIYDIGLSELEKRTVYMSLSEAQDLFGLSGQSTEVAINLKQIGEEPSVIKSLNAALPGYEMSSWQTEFPELQSALSRKTGVMNIFGVIILVIAGVGILNLLLMAIFERTREIGVLGALGMKPGQISILFVLEGTMMGMVGLAFGIVLGVALNFLLGRVGLDYSQFASMTEYMALISGRIYPTLGVQNLLQRGLTVVIITILSSLYPAYEAAQSEPAMALHTV